MRRVRGPAVVVVVLVPIALMTWQGIESRAAHRMLDEARLAFERGEFDRASNLLRSRTARLADRGEAAFLLGRCEQEFGNPEEALRLLSSVPAVSRFSVPAGLASARILVEHFGRFKDAEEILEPIARERSTVEVGGEAREFLAELYQAQGRTREIMQLIRANWEQSELPVTAIVRHWTLDSEPFPSELVRSAIEKAEKKAPEDARVVLGGAILALRDGRLDESSDRLASCLAATPDDPVVRRVQLDWARAAVDRSAFAEALAHLSTDHIDESERRELRAWAADQFGEAESIREALDDLLDREPRHPWGLERRIERAIRDGDDETASRLRLLKSEADQLVERYRELAIPWADPSTFPELAETAEALGRRFEAEGWWTLALRDDPLDPIARDRRSNLRSRGNAPEKAPPDGSLVELVLAGLSQGREDAAPGETSRVEGLFPEFVDLAGESGLTFVFDNGESPTFHLPETMAGGVGLLDFDRDGWMDVYAVQGGAFPPVGSSEAPGDRLFRNKGDGTFEDVTERSGLPVNSAGFGLGVAVGDVDNDGFPDLFITRWNSYTLYRNKGDGTFEDVTERSGLGGNRGWPTSAAFADLDGDGDLDLFVCHYLKWDPENPLRCRVEGVDGEVGYCDPRLLPSEPDHLFRNDNGRFVDVTEGAGIGDREGRGLGVVAADLDGDGLVDLYVANDTTANHLFRNLGGMRFAEIGEMSGVAAAANGGYQAGMGVACGDLDGDGLPDLLVTNFHGEGTTFYQNLNGGQFVDSTAQSGIQMATEPRLGFGLALLDANNDGRIDLAQANGHVNDFRASPYRMPASLLLGDSEGRWHEGSDRAGPAFAVPRVGRALARGDLDNDGRIDLVLVGLNEPIADLRNRTESAGHWLVIELEGTASNRDAVGSVVTVEAEGRRWRSWRSGGGSYQSSNDPRLHFGLGDVNTSVTVEVRWPSGVVERFPGLPTDHGYHLIEGNLEPLRLPAPWPSG